ncbi:MAG: redoxin domain-containing protein [Prevotella sp.]
MTFGLLMSVMVALATTGGDDKCTVSGNITGHTGDAQACVLRMVGGLKRDTIQRTAVKDGKFTFVLESDRFNEAYEIAIGSNPAHPTFFAEKGTVTIEGKYNELFFAKASGTRANNEYFAYRRKVAQTSEDRNKEVAAVLKGNLSEEQKQARKDAVIKKYDAIMAKHVTDLIGDGTSLAAVYVYWQSMMMYSADEIEATLKKFNPSLVPTKYYKDLEKRALTLRGTAPGATAPKFEGVTPDGKTMSIDDMKGKYFILDFWASWCRPCRAEGKNIKAIYEQLKDKNFDVLSVSSDQDEAAWRKAMQEDGMTWKQLLLVGENQKKVYAQYGIIGIPAIWVVDPNGKIIAKQLRGEKLKQFCLDLFK